MLQATTVSAEEELVQISSLSRENLKANLDAGTRQNQGFITWFYPTALLKQLHALAPQVIVKDGKLVAGYALVALKEAAAVHPDLKEMFRNIDPVLYKGRPLESWKFYCMGQICIAPAYRGKGIVKMLYEKHKEIYQQHYDFVLTEISTSNQRSINAHRKIGFETIHSYSDHHGEWEVVIWDWKEMGDK